MPISKPHSSLVADNKSSCTDLALYLEKENKDLDILSKKTNNLKKQREIESRKLFFFSHSKSNISTNEVITIIDKNKRKLGKKDAKFYSPTISFSPQELNQILKFVTNKKDVNSVWELNQKEYNNLNLIIQQYIRLVMTNYAKNFNRESKGLKSGNDLVYFAKIEHFRKFKGTDKEVQIGIKKTGDLKPGINTHAHIIVSRKDKTQKMKLDPTVKERSTTRKIGGNTYHIGFDRMKWTNMNEKSFDSFFKYQRPELEKFDNQYLLKNGSPKEKDLVRNKIANKSIQNTLPKNNIDDHVENNIVKSKVGNNSEENDDPIVYTAPRKKKKKRKMKT